MIECARASLTHSEKQRSTATVETGISLEQESFSIVRNQHNLHDKHHGSIRL